MRTINFSVCFFGALETTVINAHIWWSDCSSVVYLCVLLLFFSDPLLSRRFASVKIGPARNATSRQLRRIAGDRKVDIHSKLMVFGNSTIPVIGCKYTRLKKRKNVESNHKFHKPDDMSIIWILLSTFGKHAARILPVPDDIVIECLIVILWKSTMINHYSACFGIGNQNSYLAKQS